MNNILPISFGIIVITLRISIQTRSLGIPFRKSLQAAAELGAEGVEIDVRNELRLGDFSQTATRELRKLLDDYQLKVAAINYPTRRGLHETADIEKRVLAIGEAMRFAYQVGAGTVLHRAPLLDAGEEEGTQERSTWNQSLTLLTQKADHYGAQLAIVSDADPNWQAKLIEPHGENIGIGLHPALLLQANHSPNEAAELLAKRTLHLHAADAVPILGSGQNANLVELGRGTADFPEILSRLEEHAFEGWVTVEPSSSDGIAVEIDNAISYLRSL